MSAPVVGIDLGTTHTVVAALTEAGPAVLAGDDGSLLLPSAVAVDDAGVLLVGEAALARMAHAPQSGVRGFKRDMGSTQRYRVGGRELGATELSALVLREAAARASVALGEPVVRAVITVPAYFQEPQRAATREAAELAGLEVVRLINEPTAAAIAFGAADAERERRVAVLDLGGGTFDVTLLEVFAGVLEVVGTAGHARLGGEDVTDALLAWACAEAGLPAPEGGALGVAQSLLRERCEVAKRALSDADATWLELCGPDPERWTAGRPRLLGRRVLDELARPLVDDALRIVADALARAQWTAAEVDEVLLVGGATRLRSFRDRVAQRFGKAPVDGPDPDLAVALGAALEAGLVARHAAAGDLVVTDVLAHSLGVEISRMGNDRRHAGYYLPVLHRNSTLPARRVERVHTVHPSQQQVTVRVFQGDHRLVEGNQLLGSFEIGDLPVSTAEDGPTQSIDLSFAHDLNGLLEVEATVVSTGNRAHILIEQRAGRLTATERAAAIEALQALKVHPRDLLPNRLLLEQAHALHARLTPGQQQLLDGPLFQFEDALARQDAEGAAQAAALLKMAMLHPALCPPPDPTPPG